MTMTKRSLTTTMRMEDCFQGTAPVLSVAVDVDVPEVSGAYRLLGSYPGAEAHAAPLAATRQLIRRLPDRSPEAMEVLVHDALLASLPKEVRELRDADSLKEGRLIAYRSVRSMWKLLKVEWDDNGVDYEDDLG